MTSLEQYITEREETFRKEIPTFTEHTAGGDREVVFLEDAVEQNRLSLLGLAEILAEWAEVSKKYAETRISGTDYGNMQNTLLRQHIESYNKALSDFQSLLSPSNQKTMNPLPKELQEMFEKEFPTTGKKPKDMPMDNWEEIQKGYQFAEGYKRLILSAYNLGIEKAIEAVRVKKEKTCFPDTPEHDCLNGYNLAVSLQDEKIKRFNQ